jgi:hypothetical protein
VDREKLSSFQTPPDPLQSIKGRNGMAKNDMVFDIASLNLTDLEALRDRCNDRIKGIQALASAQKRLDLCRGQKVAFKLPSGEVKEGVVVKVNRETVLVEGRKAERQRVPLDAVDVK